MLCLGWQVIGFFLLLWECYKNHQYFYRAPHFTVYKALSIVTSEHPQAGLGGKENGHDNLHLADVETEASSQVMPGALCAWADGTEPFLHPP